MAILTRRGREVATVFDLIGKLENDITYSFGWGLGNTERLTRGLLLDLFRTEPGEIEAVELQKREAKSGITDIEIESQNLHLIIEAKRNWGIPSESQLRLYAPRLHGARGSAILVVSDQPAILLPPYMKRKIRAARRSSIADGRSWLGSLSARLDKSEATSSAYCVSCTAI